MNTYESQGGVYDFHVFIQTSNPVFNCTLYTMGAIISFAGINSLQPDWSYMVLQRSPNNCYTTVQGLGKGSGITS